MLLPPDQGPQHLHLDRRPAPVPLHQGAADGRVQHRRPGVEVDKLAEIFFILMVQKSFQMKIWTLMIPKSYIIQKNLMIPKSLMIPKFGDPKVMPGLEVVQLRHVRAGKELGATGWIPRCGQ